MSYVSFEWAGEPHESESIKYVDGVEVARNLYTNPSFEGSLRGFGGNNNRTVTDEWADTGTHSLRMTSTSTATRGSGYGDWVALPASSESSQGLERGKTYTAYTVVRKEEDFTQHTLGVLQAVASGNVSWQDRSPDEPGVHRLRITFTVPPLGDWFYLRVYHWGIEGDPPVWWDSLMLLEGDVETDYFDGDTPNYFTGTTYEWAGIPHASESIKYVDGVEVARNHAFPQSLRVDDMPLPGIEGQWMAARVRFYAPAPYSSNTLYAGFYGPGRGAVRLIEDWQASEAGWNELTGSTQIQDGETSGMVRIHVYDSSPEDRGYELGHWYVAVADTEEEALAQVEAHATDYFDGDTPDQFTPPTFRVLRKPVVTHEWAGEPHASESIKRVDGVEVSRNLGTPFQLGFEEGIGASVLDRPAVGEVLWATVGTWSSSSLPRFQRVSQDYPVVPIIAGQAFAMAVEVKHSRGLPVRIRAYLMGADESFLGTVTGSYVENTEYDLSVVSGAAPEGAAYLGFQIAVDSSVEDGPSVEGDLFWAKDLHVATAATETEALAQVADYFDGDTPTYKLDGVWHPVVPRVCVAGAYHQTPMKQHTNGTYE